MLKNLTILETEKPLEETAETRKQLITAETRKQLITAETRKQLITAETRKQLEEKTRKNLTIAEMLKNLKNARKFKDFKKGTVIMSNSNYQYTLERNIGEIDDINFTPHFTPGDMLKLGVFEGKYLNDCMGEFPREWYKDALALGKLSPEKADVKCNYFSIKSRLSLQEWKKRGWIPQVPDDPDDRGWFQWYCRYYIGRRIPHVDAIQIKRWRAFKRHYAQVVKHCKDNPNCRPKQKQALLQWAYPIQ